MTAPTARTRWQVGLAAAALVLAVAAAAAGFQLGGEPERPVPEPVRTGSTPPWIGELFPEDDGGDRP